VITGWISVLFPYLKDACTGLVTKRNRWLTSTAQRAWEGKIDDFDTDDEIQDNTFNWDDQKVEKLDQDITTPASQGIRSTQEDMPNTLGADPDVSDDDDDDDDDEFVIGTWLRPIPTEKWNHRGFYFGVGWGPRIADLPIGISRAPFCWHYREQSFNMQFLGGFVGVCQDKDTLAVKPEIGWAVREAPKQV
jgi:hypothetical protein